MPFPSIILAAGASRRLGTPKQLVSYRGEALLTHTLRAVREAGGDPILVVLGANSGLISSTLDLSDVQTVLNPLWQQGIATSIRAGMKALLREEPLARAVMLLVCDQPSVSATHLKLLIDTHTASASELIVASQYAGVAGIPAIFPASQFSRLQSLTGDTGARQILRAPNGPMLTIALEGGEMDIDEPEDLKSLE